MTSTRYHMRYHTRHHTFSLSLTWVDHNTMHYHKSNVLPHTIPYIFTQFSMILGLFETCYHMYKIYKNLQIYKKMYINILFKKLMVTRGNPLQITPKQTNHRENIL